MRGAIRRYRGSARSETARVMSVPIISLADTLLEIEPRPPAKRSEFGDIKKLSWSTVGLGRVKDKPTLVTSRIGNDAGELHNR